jgi:cob(I)alamin adenosyltransferase
MLYTKKGDGGTTKLFDCPQGTRLDKNELIFEALGTVDEVNSLLGVIKIISIEKSEALLHASGDTSYSEILEKIQNMLFSIQAEIGGSPNMITEEHVQYLEAVIKKVEDGIPPITTFIVYGGNILAAHLDVARAVSRRCERLVVGVSKQGMREVNPQTLQFLNRLSSVLYALARYSNFVHNCEEEPPRYG